MFVDTFMDTTINGGRMAVISGAKGPDEGDNYTIYLWDDGLVYKTYSFHIANAGAVADDWCYNAHGGVYASPELAKSGYFDN